MATARRTGAENSKRTDLLNAAQALMLDEGYAAVSSRRVAHRLGFNAALVYYYFENMDDLFLTLFRCMADETFERQSIALASPQPLWALWELSRDQSNTKLSMEIHCLSEPSQVHQGGNSPLCREVPAAAGRRRLQRPGPVRRRRRRVSTGGPDLFLARISRFLLVEEAFGMSLGHAEAMAMVERFLRQLEGDRLVDINGQVFGFAPWALIE
jgi:AcrR family transcriptional regulator